MGIEEVTRNVNNVENFEGGDYGRFVLEEGSYTLETERAKFRDGTEEVRYRVTNGEKILASALYSLENDETVTDTEYSEVSSTLSDEEFRNMRSDLRSSGNNLEKPAESKRAVEALF